MQECWILICHNRNSIGNVWNWWDLPGGSVIGTLRFHCKGHRFNPLVRELESCMLYGTVQKKRKQQTTLKQVKRSYASILFLMSINFWRTSQKSLGEGRGLMWKMGGAEDYTRFFIISFMLLFDFITMWVYYFYYSLSEKKTNKPV